MYVVIDYADTLEANVTFKEEDGTPIIEVNMKEVPQQMRDNNNELKKYDLSLYSEDKNFNIVAKPRAYGT